MRVAIIGCGFVAPAHILGICRIKGIEVAAVVDHDIEKARKFSEEFKIPEFFSNTTELLKKIKPDVVHILTPPQTHKELAIEIMRTGCHVLLEKPMAPNAEEADAIYKAAKDNKVTLGLCHNFLFIPCVIQAKKMLKDGKIGNLVAVDIAWRPEGRGLQMEWTKDLPGGAMHEILPHPVYLQREFVGNLEFIAGITRRGGDSRGPDCEISILLSAEKGTTQIEVSPSGEPKQIWMRIEGTKMSLYVDISSNTLIKVRKIGRGVVAKAFMNIDQAFQLLYGTLTSAITILKGGYSNGHYPLIEDFYRNLHEGKEPYVTGKDGCETVTILDAIWQTK